MNGRLIAILWLSCLLLLARSASGAQGLWIGIGGGVAAPANSSIDLDSVWAGAYEVEPETGIALEPFSLGYNFSPEFGLNANFGFAWGETDWDEEVYWIQSYYTFNARYTFLAGNSFEPYIEAGVGQYTTSIFYEDELQGFDAVTDPEIGIRAAVGGNLNLGHLFLAPEFSYHWVEYEYADVDDELYGHYSIDFNERGDMFMFLLKVGYQFGG